jgi:peptide/nickel transport system ATP-binding protein
MSYLFISHDIGVVSHVSSRIAVMKSGRIVEIGQAQEIIQNPQDPYTRQLLAAAGVYRPQPSHATTLA